MSDVDMNSQSLDAENQALLMSWLAVIGSLTMFWSPVERRIDQCVHLLYESRSAKKPAKKLRLGEKLKFINSEISNSNISPTIMESWNIEDLKALTMRTVRIRDVCVHGVLESFDQYEIKIGKVDGKRGEHVIEVFTIDRARLDRSASALITLQEKWGAIASALLEVSTHA